MLSEESVASLHAGVRRLYPYNGLFQLEENLYLEVHDGAYNYFSEDPTLCYQPAGSQNYYMPIPISAVNKIVFTLPDLQSSDIETFLRFRKKFDFQYNETKLLSVEEDDLSPEALEFFLKCISKC